VRMERAKPVVGQRSLSEGTGLQKVSAAIELNKATPTQFAGHR
jgi:hypothetical protein